MILVEQDYDHVDLDAARSALAAAGATVHLVGPIQGRTYQSRDGQSVVAEHAASAVRAADVDGVMIPGGFAADRIRLRHAMVDLVRDAVEAGKPVAAIDHGPSVFINARVLSGRQLTCWPSIAVDAKNAGAPLCRSASGRGRQPDHLAQVGRPAVPHRGADSTADRPSGLTTDGSACRCSASRSRT